MNDMLGEGLYVRGPSASTASESMHSVQRPDAISPPTRHDPTAPASISHTMYLLVERFFNQAGAAPGGGEGSQRRKLQLERAFQYSMRVLRSRMEAAVLPDDTALADTIKRRLIRREKSMDKAMQFSNLFQKLTTKSALKNKWACVYFLLAVSEQANRLPGPDQHEDSTLFSIGLESIPDAGTEKSDSCQKTTTYDGPSDASSRHPPAGLASDTENTQYLKTWRTDSNTVLESEWLQDIVYVFQGIDGRYIKYNDSTETYIIDEKVQISQPLRELLHRLTELGWLYRRITSFLKFQTNQAGIGLMAQSFCSAIQREMTDYYRLIAILQAQITPSDDQKSASRPSLTLKRLYVWTQDPLQRLRVMGVLVDLCVDDRGGELLATLHDYVHHGDPFIQQFIHHLMTDVCKPFYNMLKLWIYEGQLDDPFDEFFIVGHPVGKEEDFWEVSYSMRENMIPSFIEPLVAKKIFMIGKNLNFLRSQCGDSEYVIMSSQQGQNAQGFEYGNYHTLRDMINKAYTATTQKVIDSLLTKYKLMEHLEAIRKYLFLGQGDLIQYVVDEIGVALTKPANTLFRHNLASSLETGIRMSNAQYDDPDITSRLDVRMLQSSPGDIGWDVFTLVYQLQSPINTVINNTAMHLCKKISNFLWKMKRVEHALSSTWKPRMRLAQNLRHSPIYHDLHTCLLTWAEMNHFVLQMQYYVLFEVLECSWDELKTLIASKPDMDLLIRGYLRYLNTIISKSMLGARKHKDEPPTLFKIVDVILEFREAQERLHKYGTALARQEQKANLDFRERSFDISHIHADGDLLPEEDGTESLENIRAELNRGAERFREELSNFMELLAEHADETLRALSVRLSFNEYYSTGR
ncbi:hypothetical protein SpCBS45565_g04658 [Spizellomyces sp. 'palustris']|nr:hypothetical protein SpCBS45565_g04658 [Spizellomyces sp. 'palustris']